ncbi:sphingolipid C4-hydroxylase Sur2p [Trichomonascus vanleenenianus]|uniref:sphingosine hydroxylase n=1 Tax=Trichomonascus vanleenenianus TaxID=2268995 RepID=UPI003ECB4FB1
MFNSTATEAPAIEKFMKPDLLPWMSDAHLALVLPLVMYWSMGLGFYLIDRFELCEKYRLHTPKELSSRNRCSVREVLRAVFVQHAIQTLAGLALDYFEPPQYTGHEQYEMWKLANRLGVSHEVAFAVYYGLIPAAKIFMAFFIMDTWQYMLHRFMHQNKFLYRHLHSVHHRLYVPYAFGALYNSLLEGFLLDTLGAGIAHLATGLTTRESIIFYTVSTMKTVDDHCGYELPFDPFQVLFPNNAVYHDIHHQQFGIKTNFSQPFFIHWDSLFKTRYASTKTYAAQQRKIRLDRYTQLQASKAEKKTQ